MIPHERSLVKRFEGKPFVLLGINSDENRDQLKKSIEKEKITWRSWWDRSPGGPIATQWSVEAWPTIYVLDHKGIIRNKGHSVKALEETVDTLLEELAAVKNSGAPGKK